MSAATAQRAMDELMEIPIEEERKLVDRIEQAYNDGLESYDIAECLKEFIQNLHCLLYTSPSPRDLSTSRMPSSA